MPNSLSSILQNLKAEDLHLDSSGRLVVSNPAAAQKIAAAVPNLKRLAGEAASNNCNCGGGGGGSGCGSIDLARGVSGLHE